MAVEMTGGNNETDLTIASGLVTAPPFTLACWFVCDDFTTGQDALMCLVDASASDQYHILYRNEGNLRARTRATDASNGATSTTGTAGTVHHGCGVWASATSRSAYLDGGGKGTNTTERIPSGIDQFSIGELTSTALTWEHDGRVMDAAIWNAALIDAEVASLAAGAIPASVRPSSLVDHWTLFNSSNLTGRRGNVLTPGTDIATADGFAKVHRSTGQLMIGVPAAAVGGATGIRNPRGGPMTLRTPLGIS